MATEDEDRRLWHLGESLSIMIESESERQSQWKKSNVLICKLPELLRNHNATAYTPRITSIGPLHKEDKRLSSLDSHKVTYMHRLYSRVVKKTKRDIIQITLSCSQAVFGLLPRARACYVLSLHCYDDIKLAEMMVIDGCFILELLYRFQYAIGEGDPIFDNILVMHDVKHDLMLLENQIPFFILKTLFNLTVKQFLRHTSLTKLILDFFKDMNIVNNSKLTTNDGTVEHCHILGLLQSCYRRKSRSRRLPMPNSFSATKIAGAGVTFKPQNYRNEVASDSPKKKIRVKAEWNEYENIFQAYRSDGNGVPFEGYWDENGDTSKAHRDTRYLLSVTLKQKPRILGFDNLFSENTSFIIPQVCINDSNLSFLRNLIAYEQCDPLGCHNVTSFALLMEKLIDNKDDVSLLVRSNVLHHNLGSSEDAANILKHICKGVVVRRFYYNDELYQLQDYCNQSWRSKINASRRLLRRLYRSATWKVSSVIAAAILFALTLIQTICAVRG